VVRARIGVRAGQAARAAGWLVVGLGEGLVEILAGVLALERRRDLFVAAPEGERVRLERGEVGEVVGARTLR
jgi:hypothetical protein